jgi:hypothetical protein
MPLDAVREVEVTSRAGRLWFGFPHYVVLGWAILVSGTLYELRDWRQNFEVSQAELVNANREALGALVESIRELQREQRKLSEDSIRTRTLLELKFPVTARRVEDALTDETGQ